MTFPVIDPTQGIQVSSNGRDLVPIWPQEKGWLANVLRVTLWQFKGAWKYDLTRGVDYLGEVHGHVTAIPVLQSIFRRAISRYAKIDRLLVTKPEDDEVSITFSGPNIEQTTIELLEDPAIVPITPEAAGFKGSGSTIAIRVTEELNPYAIAEPEDFELIGTVETITAVSVLGTHIFLTLSGDANGDVRVLYRRGDVPLQGISRTQVDPFSLLVPYDTFGLMITEGGLVLLTEGGLPIILE